MDSKERIIFLLKYLKENTDEETEVSAAELRRLVRERGGTLSPATLRDDIASLQRAGIDIAVREENGKGTYYRFLDRDWAEAELQILVDAVSAGQFLSRKKSNLLIRKLKQMAGPSLRERLEPGILTDDQVKAPNEQVLYTVQRIREAIRENRRIRFRYYELTRDLERRAKHDGYIYEVSPYAMVWKKDRYYLVGWSEKHGDIAHFRIDRMEVPRISAKERRPAPEGLRLEDRADRIFSMFDGPEEVVTLRLKNELIGQAVDQFGEGIRVTRKGVGFLDIAVTVHLSPTFYAWVFQFTGKMKILSPEHVQKAYAEYLKEALDRFIQLYLLYAG